MQKSRIGNTSKSYWAVVLGITTLGLNMAKPADAFSVTYNFTVQISSDAYEAQGLLNGITEQGSFTYDDTYLTGIGSEYASGLQGNLTLQFNFLNHIYAEKDDLNYGNNSYLYDYPTAFFSNGTLLGLDFLVVPSQLQPPQNALGFRIFNDTFYAGATDNFNSGSPVGTVIYGLPISPPDPPAPSGSVAAVPEPSAIGGAIVAFSCLGIGATKKLKGKRGNG